MTPPKYARFVKNLMTGSREPLIMRGLFQAGSTQEIVAGQILEFTADTAQRFTPIDSDANFATAGDLAVAVEDIAAGDRAGYYKIIAPRPYDVFAFDLAAASAIVRGTALYYSSPTAFAISGSNVIGYSVGEEHYPDFQEHLSKGGLANMGETVRSTGIVLMTFRTAVSYLARFQKA